jgi:hypothetical protein
LRHRSDALKVGFFVVENMLDRSDIDQFKQIYQQEFGVDLDDQTALKLATNLLSLVKAVSQPIPADLGQAHTKKEIKL